jgi:N-acetylneuraminate synthase
MIKLRKPPFLIAEIGINHNGSLKLAKKMIDIAKRNNFSAVKFQKRNPDISTPEKQKEVLRNTPWGTITYLQYKKKIELKLKDFKEIDRYCKKINIEWFCSPWDIDSVNFLKKFKLKKNKIPSALLTNTELLKAVAKQKKFTLISTGMSNMKDIETAVKIFKKNKCKFALMHCVSTYPCPERDLNLNTITTLKKKFKCEVGYSGHENSVSPTVAAWVIGADYIERHITLNRTLFGTDQSASLEESGVRQLSAILSRMPTILGDGVKKMTNEEKKLIKKFKYWS